MNQTPRSDTPLPAYWLVLLAAGGCFALTMGTRQTMGLFLSPLNTHTGLGINAISLAFGVGQLWYGLTQPFAGAMADKLGAGRVLFLGVLMVALGTFLTPFMSSTAGLIFTIGVLGAGGAGMAGPAVLMSVATRMVAPENRAAAGGMVNAGGSFGQFAMGPLAGGLIAAFGWQNALQIMGGLTLIALPAAFVLGGRPAPQAASVPAMPTMQAIRLALQTPSYLMLAAGFFVCGFHVAFLVTHLPGVIAACGLPLRFSAWSLGIIGLFNILGSLAMGWAMGRWRMKSLLALVYAMRGLAVLVFLLAPKTEAVMLIFAAFMGLTFLSTVPPTAGLVARLFGPGNMATLFGIVLLTHQIGSFLGAWLGGRIYGSTGSYDWMWYIDIVLAVAAALIHLPIRETQAATTTA
jgi:MFS family permease